MKKKLFALLAIVLAVSITLSGCVLFDTQTDALAETGDWYLPLNSYAYNGTSWVRLPGAGGGGGGGLWQVAGGDTELIIADSLDIQSQFIHNVLDPVLNQDAATKIYVDTADTTLANDIATNATAIATNAAAIAVNVGNIATNTANIATNTADIASNASAIVTNAADIASNATAIATNTANIATNTADVASNATQIATNTADISSNATALATHTADDGIHTTTTTAAVTLYVDAGAGDDGDDGSSGSPKATIQGALDALPVVIAHPVTINVRGQQDYPEGNATLYFDRFDTLDAITIQAVNANDEVMYDNGVADAGGANNELVDAAKAWTDDQFNGAYVWIYAGTGAGQVRTILDTVDASDKVVTTANWAVNPDGTSYYAIGGGATMTGTGSYHFRNNGKNVDIYGFAHEGATVYDVYVGSAGSSNVYYNYSPSGNSVRGLGYATLSRGYAYYNCFASSTNGVLINNAFAFPRGTLFLANTTGVTVQYMGLATMTIAAGYVNYFDTCGTGASGLLGSGIVSAQGQTYDTCGSDHPSDATSWDT